MFGLICYALMIERKLSNSICDTFHNYSVILLFEPERKGGFKNFYLHEGIKKWEIIEALRYAACT